MNTNKNIPVLILGGQENTISLARSFGRRGIPVYISAQFDSPTFKSRYCLKSYPYPAKTKPDVFWEELLLSNKHPELKGCVIMVCSDHAVEYIAHNKKALTEYFIMDNNIPEIDLAMLNKQKTLILGKSAGCPAPAFYNIDVLEDVDTVKNTILFPVMIKPLHSHLFQQHFKNKKYLTANDKEELRNNVKSLLDKDLELMVTEMIPGADDLQSAYYTYMDEEGNELFQYTHKIIRRYPKNSGNGCLHVTEWLPETAEMGQRFFKGIGFRGMGHIEFKHDVRDGQLKIIECNPRFSAAQAIVAKSGLDMAYIIYCHLTGKPLPEKTSYKIGVRRWMVLLDCLSLIELRRLGEITTIEWLKSIKGPALVFPYFSLDDPGPFLAKIWADFSSAVSKRLKFLS